MRPESVWEVWLDANISPIIAKWMAEQTGMVVKSSYSLGLSGKLDRAIYDLAKSSGSIIFISKDSDFSELISRSGFPPKLILLGIGNTNNKVLWEWLKPNLNEAFRILMTTEVAIIVLEE